MEYGNSIKQIIPVTSLSVFDTRIKKRATRLVKLYNIVYSIIKNISFRRLGPFKSS